MKVRNIIKTIIINHRYQKMKNQLSDMKENLIWLGGKNNERRGSHKCE